MAKRTVTPRIAGALAGRSGGPMMRPYTTRKEYVKHARLLWRTARSFARLGDTVLSPDYEARAYGLLATARTLTT